MHRLDDSRLQMLTHTHRFRWDDYGRVAIWRGLLCLHISSSVFPHYGPTKVSVPVTISVFHLDWDLKSQHVICLLCVCVISNLSWVHCSFFSDQQKENIWGLFLEAFTGLDAEMSRCQHIMTLMAVGEYINTIERDFRCNNVTHSVLCIKNTWRAYIRR